MKNGKYVIKFSKIANKNILKNSSLEKNAKTILNLMI